jgi:hypothetical protein
MITYVRQVAICESVRERIKQALAQSGDVDVTLKVYGIPTTDSILRAVSLSPTINTEETLRAFIIEHILGSLRLTAIQREHLSLNT